MNGWTIFKLNVSNLLAGLSTKFFRFFKIKTMKICRTSPVVVVAFAVVVVTLTVVVVVFVIAVVFGLLVVVLLVMDL